MRISAGRARLRATIQTDVDFHPLPCVKLCDDIQLKRPKNTSNPSLVSLVQPEYEAGDREFTR